MKRREFLRAGALSGAAALVGDVAQAATTTDSPEKVDVDTAVFDLEEITIAELQRSMVSGQRTARSTTEQYLDRIDAMNLRGPAIRAIIETNPDALTIADELDRERKRRGSRGPLHGIPVLLKDNIDTHDRMTTTAGSYALEGSIPARDAFIAKRLRDAGAILLGKANMSEWANFRSTHSSSGWSGRGGQARSPYVLDRNPCGSSSGSASAVAGNFVTVAVGTETDGSIVCPASANCVVGIKPTLGIVSRSGIIPIAHSQDTAGPMARTVTDAAILLGVLAGIDAGDRAMRTLRAPPPTDYTRFLDPNALKGARIGVARERFFGYSDATDNLANEAIAEMKRRGAIIIDPANIPNTGKFDDTEYEVLLYEFKADLNTYLASLGARAPVKSLKEIIAFNEANRSREMPFFGQEIMLQAEKKGALSEKKYRDALARNLLLSRAQGIDALMNKHRLDAIVAPTGGPPWVTDLINGDHFTGASATPAAVAGYPNINVPAGFHSELPVGISFFGRPFSESKLIAIAYAYEQATKHRRAPRFIPTLGA